MTTWFTSDLHFGHKSIIKCCQRPWCRAPGAPTKDDVAEMNAVLVANWNSVVKPEDVVWNLGDLAFCCAPEVANGLRGQLNGAHHLLLGNHDPSINAPLMSFASVHEGLTEIEVEGQLIVLCHYPMRSWHGAQKGSWHLFGHTHGLLRPFGKSVDVGVDNTLEILRVSHDVDILPQHKAQYMRPISFAEVKAFMDAQSIGAHERFGGYMQQTVKETV